MNPIDERYIGNVCEIRSFSNELIGIGVVREVGEDYITIGARDSELRLFNTFQKIKLNIFNSKVGFTVIICEVLASTRKMLRVVSPIKIVDHERRRGFRVAVDINAHLSVSKEKLDRGEYEDLQVVWIKDMSICGLKIHSDKKYVLGQVVWIAFELDERTKLNVKAQFVRDTAVEGEDGIKEYGIKLLFDREEDSDKLCSYLFKAQREQSQKIR
ncbi:MAG: PilZ domain-containing protein [Ruminococcus sp.]|nr:PilZ domain-containing protein [Ruminococcus sp.]